MYEKAGIGKWTAVTLPNATNALPDRWRWLPMDFSHLLMGEAKHAVENMAMAEAGLNLLNALRFWN